MAKKSAQAMQAKLDATKLTATAAAITATAAQSATAAQGFNWKAFFAGLFAHKRVEFKPSKELIQAVKKSARLKDKASKLRAQLKAIEAADKELTAAIKLEVDDFEAAYTADVQTVIDSTPEAEEGYDEFCAGNVDKHGTAIPLIEQFTVDTKTVTYKRQTSMKFNEAEFKATDPAGYDKYVHPQIARRMTIK